MLVSFCIPTHGRYDKLKKCIESITKCGLDKNEYEIIVSDDTDESIDLSEFSEYNLKYIKFNNVSKSIGANRNNCIKNCSGKWYINFDDDDLCIENSMLFMREYRNNDYLVTSITTSYKDDMISANCGEEFIHGKIFNLDFLRKNNILFEENKDIAEDENFMLKCRLSSSDILYLYYYGFYYWYNDIDDSRESIKKNYSMYPSYIVLKGTEKFFNENNFKVTKPWMEYSIYAFIKNPDKSNAKIFYDVYNAYRKEYWNFLKDIDASEIYDTYKEYLDIGQRKDFMNLLSEYR